MNQPSKFLKFVKAATILCLAAMYCLLPLQKPLLEGFHKLEHVILSTSANHTHEDAFEESTPHVHQHEMLSFFKNLFGEDTQDSKVYLKCFELDKHLVKKGSYSRQIKNNGPQKKFLYTIASYSVSISSASPPPKSGLS